LGGGGAGDPREREGRDAEGGEESPSTGMLDRSELAVEDLLKIVLLLVIALLVLEIVGLFVEVLASISPVVAVVIVVLIIAYLLDWI